MRARRRIPRKTAAPTGRGTELERLTPEDRTATPVEAEEAAPDRPPPTETPVGDREIMPIDYVVSEDAAPPGGDRGGPVRGGALPGGGLSADQVAYLRGLGVMQGADGGWVRAMPDGGNTVKYQAVDSASILSGAAPPACDSRFVNRDFLAKG